MFCDLTRFLPLGGDDYDADSVLFDNGKPQVPRFDLVDATAKELKVGVIRRFFSPEEIALVHRIAHEPSVAEVDDRDDDLDYKHHVWRFEHEIKEHGKTIYDKLLTTARGIDAELWGAIEENETLFPEIEYIVYDVEKLSEPGKISPHRDNQSKVSAVVLLSPPEDFNGGVNFFEGGDNGEPDRRVELGFGDAVFFYGDVCSHWITPVVSGRRTILQIELSMGWPSCPTQFGGWLDFLL